MMQVPEKWIEMNAQPFCGITEMSGLVVNNVGVSFRYEKAHFKSVEFDEHGDILCGSFTSIDGTFVMDNSVSRGSVVTQDIVPRLNMAQFYLAYGYEGIQTIEDYRFFIFSTEIDNSSDTVTFRCKSVLGFMTAAYAGITTGTAAEIADAVFYQAESDRSVPKTWGFGIRYEYDDSLNDTNLILGTGYTMAEVLQIIANACKCVIYIDNFGKIYITPRNTSIHNYAIPRLFQYSKPIVKVDQPIHGVKITYVGGSAAVYSSTVINGQIQTVDNPALVSENSEGAALARFVLSELSDHPQTVSCDFRADPRLELFDLVQVEYGGDVRACVITDIKLSYNGGWRGTFTGRDMGDGIVSDDDSIDIYNTMTEYLSSVENGSGDYQEYTVDYDTFKSYIEGVG